MTAVLCMLVLGVSAGARAQADVAVEPPTPAVDATPPPPAPSTPVPPAPSVRTEPLDRQQAPVIAQQQPTLTERLLLRQQWKMYREHDREQIRLGLPITGTVFGAAAVGTAAWLYATDESAAGTLVTIFVVAPLLTASLIKLVERVKKRRAIEREIWSLPPVSAKPFVWTF